jgi:antitoxin VapB
MAFNLGDPEADRLARELAAGTGENLAEAVVNALRERIQRTRRRKRARSRMADELLEIGRHFSSLPLLDNRSEDEIPGFGRGQ